MNTNENVTCYWALREQASYLRSPILRSGPSVQESKQ